MSFLNNKEGLFFFFFLNFACDLFSSLFIYLFIYFWLCWVFVSVGGLSLVAASGGHSSSRCVGLSLSWPLLLRSTGSRRAGSVAVAHGPSCSTACGIFPDRGTNPCPLHWQEDSQPLCHQGSPKRGLILLTNKIALCSRCYLRHCRIYKDEQNKVCYILVKGGEINKFVNFR